MKRVYLDDCRVPIDKDWIVVKTYEEFVDKVKEIGLENIDIISLDHDLSLCAMNEYFNNCVPNFTIDYNNIKEKTGYDAAKWLVNESIETDIKLPTIYTHSANPVGCANIMGYINQYLANCELPQTCVRVRIEHTVEG
jgi:hypothetical protein